MGASEFQITVKRRESQSMIDAFREKAEQSRHESGHSYSGEIGMKREVKCVRTPETFNSFDQARNAASELLCEAPYDDKWGPAWALEVWDPDGKNVIGWVFFGVASS